jgi:cysteine-rich repeat protein
MTASNVVTSSSTITVTITVNQVFTFASQTEMNSFIQYQFPPAFNPSVAYCMQAMDDRTKYNCVFTYYTGIPQTPFTIQFTCNKNGYVGSTTANVNPNLPTNLCGNGLPNPGELCDDGNTNDRDGCSSQCQQ